MAFVTHTIVAIPETMVFAKQITFLNRKTIVPVARTMISGLDTTVVASDPMFSVSKTIVADTKTMFCDDLQIIDIPILPAMVDFDNVLRGRDDVLRGREDVL